MAATMRTDIGKKRKQNEDSAWFGENLYVVADGMGGHLAGEVASGIAVDTIKTLAGQTPALTTLGSAVARAHKDIKDHAMTHESCSGMGTTLSVLWRAEGRMYIAHVGDSRIYRLRDGRLEQITQDHSLVDELVRAGIITKEEARTHPRRNIITRALGTQGENDPDLFQVEMREDDKWLLCTDGLSGMVRDEEIEDTLNHYDMEEAADRLLNLALDAGGSDNITLILCTGGEGAAWTRD